MSSDEVRDVIATLREVPRYVVRNDALTSRAVVGFDKWKGTTDVVLHADHLTAMQEKDRRHAEALAEAYVECDQMVDSAATAGVRLGRAEALREAREAVQVKRDYWAAMAEKEYAANFGGSHYRSYVSAFDATLAAIDTLAARQAFHGLHSELDESDIEAQVAGANAINDWVKGKGDDAQPAATTEG